jgi:chromosome segregation ATPase
MRKSVLLGENEAIAKRRELVMTHAEEIETLRNEVAQLRDELDRMDDWANGLMGALQDLALPLLRTHPDIADTVKSSWRLASVRWEKLQADTGQADDFHETADLLEPRKMLYRALEGIGVFPPPWCET